MKKSTTMLMLLFACLCTKAVAQTTSTDEQLTQLTSLPTLYITTTSGKDPADKVTYLPCTVTLVENGKTAASYTIGKEGIRGRGNSTWSADKKPWRLKFDKGIKFLGDDYAKAKSWTLLANAYDKSLMRNALTWWLGKRVNLEFCPAYKFVDLVLNGTYWGVYQISDQVDVRAKRVDINEDKGWLLEYANAEDKVDEPKIDFGTYGYVQIKNPEFEDDLLTSNQTLANEITSYVNDDFLPKLATSVTGYDYINPREGYRCMVDTASLINWYVATEITANWDGFYSVYMFRDPTATDTKMHFGPLWDEDLAYHNNSETTDRSYFPNNKFYNNLLADCNFSNSTWGGYRKLQPVIKHLWDDPWFAKAVQLRFNKLMDEGLEDYLCNAIETMRTELTDAAAENYNKWNINSDDVGYAIVTSGYTWTNYVDDLKSFVKSRLAFLKTQFSSKNSTNVWITENADFNKDNVSTNQVSIRLDRNTVAGTWNTICLPFGLSKDRAQYLFGSGMVLEEFDNVTTSSDGTVTLNFKVKTSEDMDEHGVKSYIKAGVPYLIKPSIATTEPFGLTSRIVTASTPETVTKTDEAGNSYSFTGTFAATQLTSSDLFVGANNTLLSPSANSGKLKPYRAYITLPTQEATKTIINIDGGVSALSNISVQQPNSASTVYSIDGQRMGNDADKLPKGVYIVNGKKTIKNKQQ